MPRQPLCALTLWVEVSQLFEEDAGAAWLKHDEWHARIDLRREAAQYIIQIEPRTIEEAEIIEWASTADMAPGKDHAEAGAAEHAGRRVQHLRL